MFFTNKDQKLYLTNVQFNMALMLTELEKIIVNRGGKVKEQTSGYIVNRSIYNKYDEEIKDAACYRKNIDLFENKPELKEKWIAAAERHEKAAAELKEKIDNIIPEHVTRLSYITFVLDGFIYYFQSDNNPFFPFYYTKTPVRPHNTYSNDACLTESKKEWLYDCFFNEERMTNADLKEVALQLLNELETAAATKIIRDSKRIRVDNRYDGGYHYETVYSPERIEKVDF